MRQGVVVSIPLEESLHMYGLNARSLNYTTALNVLTTTNLRTMYQVNRSEISNILVSTLGPTNLDPGERVRPEILRDIYCFCSSQSVLNTSPARSAQQFSHAEYA